MSQGTALPSAWGRAGVTWDLLGICRLRAGCHFESLPGDDAAFGLQVTPFLLMAVECRLCGRSHSGELPWYLGHLCFYALITLMVLKHFSHLKRNHMLGAVAHACKS